ncbi:MAG: hypothetical protein ACXV2H_09830 [Actinomycetes bacterium]
MKLYAERPLRATNQLLGDLLVLGWVVFWIWLATAVHDKVGALAGPGREAENAGNNLATSLHNAAGHVDDIPLAGDTLRRPFDDGAGAGRDFAQAAQSYQHAVAQLATFAAIAVAVIPIALLLAYWLPRRLAWIATASAARRLLGSAAGDDRALDLFALRALVNQPLSRLSSVADDPAQAWRAQDPVVLEALAELELAQLGLHARR